MRYLGLFPILLFGAITGGPASKPVSDEISIQGRWKYVEQVDLKGQSMPGGDWLELSFEGEALFSFSDGEKCELGRFRLNQKATPKEMDWLFVDEKTGQIKDASIGKGIYAIDGDTLKFTFDGDGVRPKGFDATQRTGVLNVLARVKGTR